MAKETDINVKALARLGEALVALPDAVETLDNLSATKARMESEVAARQKVLAELQGAIVKAKDAEAESSKRALAMTEQAKVDANTIMAQADIDGQELLKAAQDAAMKIKATVDAGEKRLKDIDTVIATRTDAVAKLAKQEADILARIADHKAKIVKALE